jgi:hypothetical protein
MTPPPTDTGEQSARGDSGSGGGELHRRAKELGFEVVKKPEAEAEAEATLGA